MQPNLPPEHRPIARRSFTGLLWAVALSAVATVAIAAQPAQQRDFPKVPADTGVSGVYEVIVGVADAPAALKHFALFGFRVVGEGSLTAQQAKKLYGVDSPVRAWRLQNGGIDSHGLVRVLQWERPSGEGVGYTPPSTIGHRMSVLNTADIVRIMDAFSDERQRGSPWLPRGPVYADIYRLDTDKPGLFNRRVGVYESVVYGDFFSHVFFQRHGYEIPGYGTINRQAPLAGSEFTHHDFVIAGDPHQTLAYYINALGFQAEQPAPELAFDHSEGADMVFQLPEGASRWYLGMVSPNNICGKLKFFIPRYATTDRSDQVRPGALGINMHSVYVRSLKQVRELLRDEDIQPGKVALNAFGERGFVFAGPDGAIWNVLEGIRPTHQPETTFQVVRTD